MCTFALTIKINTLKQQIMKTITQLNGVYGVFTEHTKRLKIYKYSHLIFTEIIEDYCVGDTDYWNTIRMSDTMWDINFYSTFSLKAESDTYETLTAYLVNPDNSINISISKKINLYFK